MLAQGNVNRQKVKILIVDDHPIVRQGMAQLINLQNDLTLCCEAADADQALAAMQVCDHDLAIVDISLNGVSGFELINTLKRRYPELAILVMSMHDESVHAERALRAGARGYIMKQEATDNILLAIHQILHGEIYLSAAMHTRLLQRMLTPCRNMVSSAPAGLSDREFEVLRLIGLGFGTSQIAAKLNRSVKTIETHRASLKEKLGCATATELVKFAVQWLANEA